MPVPQSLTDARTALQAARDTTARTLFARETARAALDAATRVQSPDLLTVQGAFDTAQGQLDQARGDETTARNTLNGAIVDWLKDPATQQALDPDVDLARMARTDTPIALLPLRLETRFDLGTRTLHVRIYPDEILSDIHERELTPEEQDAGAAYWKNIPPADAQGNHEDVGRWTALAKRFGVPRAAYIVRATPPSVTEPPPPRATVPSRAAEAVLPDRFVVLAYKNGQLRHQVPGLPIPEPLPLTANPSDETEQPVEVADGFTVPASISWTMKYSDALQNGMAIDVGGLADDEVATGFDRIVVIGVKTSMEPEDSSNLMSDLLDAHHFTRGLDLVPQATPTNNVPGRLTPFTIKDPSGAESFQIERLGPTGQVGDLDFVFLSQMFGFDALNGPFTFIGGAVDQQHDVFTEFHMRRVLWSATLGYFMRQMMNPTGTSSTFDDATIDSAKSFFINDIAAQGWAPPFRVGAVPYGVLPAIALSRMVPAARENATAIDVMRRLLGYWQVASASTPTVPRSAPDRNTALMRVISQKASSDGAFVRKSVGLQATVNLLQLAIQDFAHVLAALAQVANPIASNLQQPEWAAARVFGLTFQSAVGQFTGPLVTLHAQQDTLVSAITKPNDPTDSLNYLAFLADSRLPLDIMEGQGFMANVGPEPELTPLLYLLARHSLLLESVEIARRNFPQSFTNLNFPTFDLEIWNVPAPALGNGRATVFDVLRAPAGAGGGTVFDRVKANPQYGELANALLSLSTEPVSVLERVFMSTLDLVSHRLDAWITALATRRLFGLRADRAPRTYFGCYGFVEDVRPVARTSRQVPGVGGVDVQPGNGGFIHAPSLRHATAAAILRSGRMAEQSDPQKYAIELPSERARRARQLVDGVRAGQPLGALLGYELERGLRQRHVDGTEGFILALRTLYPQVANKSGLDGGQPADKIAARNVVDGQLVRQAAAAPGGLPFGSGGLPGPSSDGQRAISAEVSHLDELMDGLGDLVLGEALYQVAAGDVVTAETAMSFLSSANHPPELEVTDSPAAGVAVSHRAVLLLEGDTPPPAPAGWTLGASPRAAADPFVESWVASLLGALTGVTATVTLANGPQAGTTTSFAIASLGIGPLDFLALAQSTSAAGHGSPLDRRIKAQFVGPSVSISYDTPAAPGRGVAQLIELARAVGAVLGGARELGAADLRRPQDGVDDTALQGTADGVSARATAAVQTLTAARDGLATGDARPALTAAAAYFADAFPDPEATSDELGRAATAARAELDRRLADAQAAIVATGSNAERIAGAVAALRSVFGPGTLAVMPSAVPQGGDELRQSLAALDRPLDLSAPGAIDAHQAPGRFLQQASRLRGRLAAWRRFSLYAGARGVPAPRVSVAQLPFVAGEDWAGRAVPPESRTSILFVSAGGQTRAPDPTALWRGLVLDQWVELVPAAKAETAVAFHYDSQNAEAPQVILLGVHSGQAGGWNVAELAAIVNDTMDLAQIRPVDSDLVALGQLVPPSGVAFNPENMVVSTQLLDAHQQTLVVIG